MAINQFRWSVKPAIPGHWHGTQTHSGFEVEIAGDWIEVRREEEGQRDIQQARAQEIVEGIVRRIGLVEKRPCKVTLGSVSRFDPESNRRDITALLSCGIGTMATGHADFVLTAADGRIVADSRRDRMADLFRIADALSVNETLRRVTDYLLEYHGDPEKKLAPLFDVIELASEAFGHAHKAATLLGVGIQRMKDATDIMNDPSIRSGRHRGQELGPQRQPTPAEVQLCEEVAEGIVSEYAKLVERGTAPK